MHCCMRLSSLLCCLSSAELEVDMRAVIQVNAEHIGESTGELFAIDAEQPELVFTEDKAVSARLGINRQIDRGIQGALNLVGQPDGGSYARALRDAVRIADAELHVNRPVAVEDTGSISIDRLQDLV